MRSRYTLLLAAALWVALVLSASAHAKIVAQTPADGSNLTTQPTQVTAKFSEDIDPNGTTLTVTGPNGQTVSDQKTTVSASAPTIATVAINAAGYGTYTVNWHAVADDDKGVTDGSFTFTVGSAASGTTTDPKPASAGTSTTTYIVAALAVIVVAALLTVAALRLRRSPRRG